MKLKVLRKQFNSRMCFVCGFKNDLGLQSRFYELEDKSLCALVTFKDFHQSYPGRLHGGIAASILDETIGRAMMSYSGRNVWGVTMSLNIKYKKPVPLGVDLKVVGKITSTNGTVFEGSGKMYLPDGTVAVIADGRYLEMSIDKISDMDPENEEDWKVTNEISDPYEIEIP